MIEHDNLVIQDFDIIAELSTYILKGKEKYEAEEGSKWASVFGTTTAGATAPSGHNISTDEDDNKDGSFDVYQGAEEFLNEFGNNPVKSPFQDGHMIYAVVAGGGSGSSSYAPMIYVADLENPKNFNKKLQP